MSKTGNLRSKGQVSLITSTVIYVLINNLYAIAEAATSNNAVTTSKIPTQTASSASPMPLVIGLMVLVILGAVVFMLTKKKDPRMKLPGKIGVGKISPPSPGAKSSISPPTQKTPVVTPAKSTINIPISPKIEPVSVPQMPSPVSTPPVQQKPISPKVEMPISMPTMNSSPNHGEAKPLFDSGKLDDDLNGIFADPKSVVKEEEEEKKSPLFNSNQLDDDLDALFVEVNKKPEKPKEEKKGLFDSNQLDNDLDSLFAEDSPKSSSANNLDSLFDSPPAPKESTQSQNAPTFDLGELDFLSDNKKEQTPASSSSPLDLSFLGNENKSNSTFDLDDLNFLANDNKKEESSSSTALPSLNLSDIVNSASNTSPINTVPLSAGKIDLNNTTMGLNISEYLNSMQKTEEKKSDSSSSFNLSNTIPPHSLNMNDLMNSSPLSSNSISDSSGRKDAGVISIGKMLVDQNALEEIIKKAEKGGKAGLTTTQVITAVKGRSLDTLLVDINNVSGILGSIIVGKDGLVIANTMPENVDKDLVGALTSSLFTNIDNQVKKMKKGNLKRLTVETSSGLYILTEIEMGTLVVFGKEEQKVNLSDIYKSITAVTGKK